MFLQWSETSAAFSTVLSAYCRYRWKAGEKQSCQSGKRSRGGFIILSDLSLFPVKPSSPPPPFSSRSQGNRRVEGPFLQHDLYDLFFCFFYVPCIWLSEIDVMRELSIPAGVFSVCVVTGDIAVAQQGSELETWRAASPQDTERGGAGNISASPLKETNSVCWCFSAECLMIDQQ